MNSQLMFPFLLAWLASSPMHPDHTLSHTLIQRNIVVAVATIDAVLEFMEAHGSEGYNVWTLTAATDVVMAYESSYRWTVLGDSGKSKGLGQTPRAETPDDPFGQARVVVAWIGKSMKLCPEHPLSRYATGYLCASIKVSDAYWDEILRMVKQP